MATQATVEKKAGATELDNAVGAAFIASGIGATILGLMTAGAEASAGLKSALTWTAPVGPLSGKTGVAVLAFVLSWVLLHLGFKNRAVKLTTSFTIAVVLIVIGLLLTFPPIYDLFAAQ